jgi:hypothetical protein
MKKLLVLLVVLAMVAITSPLYAGDNVTVGGEFFYLKDSANVNGTFAKAELNISSMVGDYNTVKLELDSEGGDWADNVAVDDFRLQTDIFGALGLDLPVTLNTTIGYFDAYFTGWKYVSYSGWDFYYANWPVTGNALGPVALGAMQADIGIGPVTVSYGSDMEFQTLRFAASGGFGPVGFYATFGAPSSALGDGAFCVQVDYSGSFGDLALYVPAHIGYDLSAASLVWGAGVKVDYTSMVHFAAGLQGQTGNMLDHIVFDLSSNPIADLGVGVSAYLQLSAADAFSGLDVYVNYMFGASKFQVGYVYAPEGTTIPVVNDTAGANGLYLAVDIDY